MTWDVVCHVLQPFKPKDIIKTNFEQADTLLLMDGTAADRPNTNCIGCHSCAMACPFAQPCFNGASGKMTKCDGCVDRVKHGLKPACVKVCPFGALQLLPEEEYEAMMRDNAQRKISFRLLSK